jgi:hypothetical protein
MALTLDKEQRLQRASLVKFFTERQAVWRAVVKQGYDYVRGNFPADSVVRPDDVAKALLPIIEVDGNLRTYLDANRLTQKYWISYFTDLAIDRTWTHVTAQGARNEEKSGRKTR